MGGAVAGDVTHEGAESRGEESRTRAVEVEQVVNDRMDYHIGEGIGLKIEVTAYAYRARVDYA